MKIISQTRPSTWLLSAAVMVVGLGWAIDHRNQQGNVSKAVELVQREAPWIKVEDNSLPDWHETSLAPDEFRLTVRRLIDDSDQLVVMLTVETLKPQWHSIWSRGTTWLGHGGGHAASGVVDYKSGTDGYYSATATLSATQISYHELQLARSSLGGGAVVVEVPIRTPLDKIFILTAHSGVYPLEKPLLIGQQFGGDVQLVVGERRKVEAMSALPVDEGRVR